MHNRAITMGVDSVSETRKCVLFLKVDGKPLILVFGRLYDREDYMLHGNECTHITGYILHGYLLRMIT